MDSADRPRYRCDGCGNLTRFDVTVSQRTKAFHHFTVGGDLVVEEEVVLSRQVDEVVCRWCGHGRSVVEISDEERAQHKQAQQEQAQEEAQEKAQHEKAEPGAPSKVP